MVETPKGTNYFAGGNVRLSCRGTKITMQSDSVAAYGGNVVQFIGRVKYRDSTLTMDASRGTYYKNRELWEARGNVTTRNLTTGSTLTGPSLDYYRVVKGVRDTLEMYATGRPKIQYFPTDSGGKAAEPYVIVGDRVRFKGDDRIVAGGKVTVDRSDFASRSDSLRLDTGAGSDGTLIGGRPVLWHRGKRVAIRRRDRPEARPAGPDLPAGQGKQPRHQQGLGPRRGHDRARREQPKAGADPGLGR